MPGPYPPLLTWAVSITGGDVYLHTNYDGLGQGATSTNIASVDGQLFGYGQPISHRQALGPKSFPHRSPAHYYCWG
jgi:hypothetical protein